MLLVDMFPWHVGARRAHLARLSLGSPCAGNAQSSPLVAEDTGGGQGLIVWQIALARLRHDIDDGWLTGLDDVDGSVKRRAELLRLHNRAEAFDA